MAKPKRRASKATAIETVAMITPMIEAISNCPPREYSNISTDRERVRALTKSIVVLMSLIAATKTIEKMLTTVGAMSGTVIRQNVVKRCAPHASDASSSYREICPSAVFIKWVPIGISLTTKTRMIGARVP